MRLPFSRRNLLRLHLVQAQINQQTLKLGVLLAQLLELPDLGGLKISIPLVPRVRRLLGNFELAGDIGHRRAELMVLDRRHDLLHRLLGFIGLPAFLPGVCQKSPLSWTGFWVPLNCPNSSPRC